MVGANERSTTMAISWRQRFVMALPWEFCRSDPADELPRGTENGNSSEDSQGQDVKRVSVRRAVVADLSDLVSDG